MNQKSNIYMNGACILGTFQLLDLLFIGFNVSKIQYALQHGRIFAFILDLSYLSYFECQHT